MPKLAKLLHDLANIAQALAGSLELVTDQKDENLKRARQLCKELFKTLRQIRKHLE